MTSREVDVHSQAQAFNRLHALTRKGYRPQLGSDAANGTIVLRHLGKAHDLVLHPDGTVEELGGRIPRHKRRLEILPAIAAEKDADQIRFLTFLESVPRATLRDRTRPWRRKYIYAPGAILALLVLSIGFTGLIANLG